MSQVLLLQTCSRYFQIHFLQLVTDQRNAHLYGFHTHTHNISQSQYCIPCKAHQFNHTFRFVQMKIQLRQTAAYRIPGRHVIALRHGSPTEMSQSDQKYSLLIPFQINLVFILFTFAQKVFRVKK